MKNKNKNKNILLVIAGLANGGAENQILKLWNLLNKNGYNCYLLILNKKEKVDPKFHSMIDDERFLSLELSSQDKFLFFNILKGLIKIYRQKNIHTTVSFLHVANIFTRLSKIIFPKLQTITSIRSDFKVQYNTKNKFTEYLLSPLSTVILSNSKATVEYLNDKSIINNKAKYFPNIIKCCKDIKKTSKQDKFTIISVGRLAKEKNYDFLIKVANELKNNQVQFIILGEGNQRFFLETKIKELGLLNITIVGQVNNVVEYLQSSHLFFMPSFFEGVSNAMIEAICQDIPIYCSSGANTSGIIENEVNGFVFDEYKSEEVASVILEIKKIEKEKLKKICLRAKEKVVIEMNEKNVLKILKEYL